MKNLNPRIKLVCFVTGAVFGLSQLTWAQCPEICDSNENTALGQSALVNNTTGMNNTAVGFQALQHSNADGNTATGYQALVSNISGTFNTAYGQQALQQQRGQRADRAWRVCARQHHQRFWQHRCRLPDALAQHERL